MKSMTVNEIRQSFIDYFKSNQHKLVPSASLLPEHDPSLLFVNAGMVPFKPYFLDQQTPPSDKVVSSQRCVRAGGKHNDLENVGYTARHHTFFEMLGNFSFGAYFKTEAIRLAWNYLTEVLGIPAQRLWVTVYEEDDEAASIWFDDIGVDPSRFSRCGKKDNFWSMGDTGPCGPCTEIFYDHGADVPGGPPGSPEEDGDRYIEIWNLVFMQYNADGDGNKHPLPKPCVDTGMGLERLAAVLQGVHSNYEIDLFEKLMDGIVQTLKLEVSHDNHSLRVLADHLRSVCFLIADGVVPGNEGRSYVLRRIMRRAIRHGYALGQHQPFFYQLLPCLVSCMGDAYPMLLKHQQMISDTILQEEHQFAQTLSRGMQLLSGIMDKTKRQIAGDVVFKLYDTYGFPPDLTADIAREHDLSVDYAGFDAAMSQQKKRSSVKSAFQAASFDGLDIKDQSLFVGDQQLTSEGKVLGIYQDQQVLQTLSSDQPACLVLDQTSFYPEGGGQVGDQGEIRCGDAVFQVQDTQKKGQAIVHGGVLSCGSINVGDSVSSVVDGERRVAIRAHHSVTHLLHAVLREQLGATVTQKGSLVDADRLRFDFAFPRALSAEEVKDVEDAVNRMIRSNVAMESEMCSLQNAKDRGVMALFNEKYGDEVRVVRFGNFSQELCGGTHVSRSGDIGCFKIVQETACAQGVRRIEAVAAAAALNYMNQWGDSLKTLSRLLKCNVDQLDNKLKQHIQEAKAQQQQLQSMRDQLRKTQSTTVLDQAVEIAGIHLLVTCLQDINAKDLRLSADQLLNQLPQPAAVLLAAPQDNKIALVAKVSSDCQVHFGAVELLNRVCEPLGGRGGGRADMAQGGVDSSPQLAEVLAAVGDWVLQKVDVS